jgi:hypothetical protein
MYFPDELYSMVARDLVERKVKLVTNVGAVNPHACAAAMQAAAARLGLSPKIAVVNGDDILDRAAALRTAGRLKERLPEGVSYTGIHAYIGAFPIARALALGADIVVTGRVVDSALVLGPLIHEFGWQPDDYDRLAAGSLIGHILECGAQASGGIFTDWREIGDYSNIGYPIAECHADGSAVITKAEDTGGLVSVGTVAEQLLYEIGDPRSYRLPDVVADLSQVRFEQLGKDRVLMTGAKGRAPGPDLKAIATWDDGWFASWGFPMRGQDAADKARAIADSVFTRGAKMLRERNMPGLRQTRTEVIGDEESYGENARVRGSREVFCRMTIEAEDSSAFGVLLKEMGTGCVSMAPGIAGSLMMFQPMPMARSEAFFIPASEITPVVTFGDHRETVERFAHGTPEPEPDAAVLPLPDEEPDTTVPLSKLAWARSGDKGDICNVGVVARRPEYLPYIAAAMDEQTVAEHYAFMFRNPPGRVERHYLPGSDSINFMLQNALDGGCTVSLRFDPFGKSAAQDALDLPVAVPSSLLD